MGCSKQKLSQLRNSILEEIKRSFLTLTFFFKVIFVLAENRNKNKLKMQRKNKTKFKKET